jgi:hypothetical protein
MYYIFNNDNNCIASCDYKPNSDDLISRKETMIKIDTVYPNLANLKLNNGNILVIEKTDVDNLLELQSEKISSLKYLLKSTDYQAIKYAEGIITSDQYSKMKELRILWRKCIEDIKQAKTIEEINKITWISEIS